MAARESIAKRVQRGHEAVAEQLVAAFDASGVEYTSRAAILSVIDDKATLFVVRYEYDNPSISGRLKARRAINLACERIHERGTK